jgi:hypothetical protein
MIQHTEFYVTIQSFVLLTINVSKKAIRKCRQVKLLGGFSKIVHNKVRDSSQVNCVWENELLVTVRFRAIIKSNICKHIKILLIGLYN